MPLARARRLIQTGEFASLLSVLVNVLAQYGMHIFLAAWLPMADYGIVSVGLAVGLVAAYVVPLGFSQSLLKYVSVYTATSQHALLRGVLLQSVLITACAGLVTTLIGFAFISGQNEGSSVYASAIGLGLISALPTALIFLGQAAGRGFGLSYAAIIPHGTVVPLLALITCLVVGDIARQGASFLVIYAIASLLVAAFQWAYLLSLAGFRAADGAGVSYKTCRWIRESIPMVITTTANQFVVGGHIFIISALAPPESVAVYSLAVRFARLVTVGNRALGRYWARQMARLHAAGDRKSLQDLSKRASRAIFGVATFAAIGLLLAGGAALARIGEQYRDAFLPMVVVVFGHLVMSFFASGTPLMQMASEERAAAWIYLIVSIAMAALFFTVVPILGINGAALVTALGLVAIALAGTSVCKRRLRIYVGAI